MIISALLLVTAVSGCTHTGSADYSEMLSDAPEDYRDSILDYCQTFWESVSAANTHYCISRYVLLFSQEGGCLQGFEDRHEQFCEDLDSGYPYIDYWDCQQDSRYRGGVRQCGYIEGMEWEADLSAVGGFAGKGNCLSAQSAAITEMDNNIDNFMPVNNNSVSEVHFVSQICTWACNCSVMSTSGGFQMYCPSAETSQCKIMCSSNIGDIAEHFKDEQEQEIITAYACDSF